MIAPPKKKLIVLTGPTATGKTRLAACVAAKCNGEIISADSRQVYRGMDIGSGKDLGDYRVGDTNIPYHLVNIANPGYEYNVFEFQQVFKLAFSDIEKRKKQAILSGGTGLYIEAVLNAYRFKKADYNQSLREELQLLSNDELEEKLSSLRTMHNSTDTTDRLRLIRAIEIEMAENDAISSFPKFSPIVFAIHYEREVLRNRITERLQHRLQNGMIEEISTLLGKNLQPEQLAFYGLEYRIVTQYVTGEISYKQMFETLNIAIHQFAKRQMTWFRRMERNGTTIHWIDGNMPMDEKVDMVLAKTKQSP
ncbi:MAG TPA: tRNA (adenosine(37)-N6)-dimethylallyltransferase MiaA [Bacteroidales bacterium]|nr:tRNA (adenosine(37)-N6)-dimethylallyltransferase MiaA [Bacteroidales bacterium]